MRATRKAPPVTEQQAGCTRTGLLSSTELLVLPAAPGAHVVVVIFVAAAEYAVNKAYLVTWFGGSVGGRGGPWGVVSFLGNH